MRTVSARIDTPQTNPHNGAFKRYWKAFWNAQRAT